MSRLWGLWVNYAKFTGGEMKIFNGEKIKKVRGDVLVETEEGYFYRVSDKWLMLALSEFLWSANDSRKELSYPDHISEIRGE